MSDPHGHGGGGGTTTISPTALAIYFVLLIVFTLYFYFNQESVSTVITILNYIQVISLLIIGYMAYRLWNFMKEFSKTGGEIVANYEKGLKHHHEHKDEKAPLKAKYLLSLQHLNSHTESEWKTGLIELDNFIRMALIDQGYVGSTTLELLKDAKEKGHQFVKNAEDIAYLRQRLKSASNRFDFTHEDIQLLVDKFTDFKNTIIPEEDRGHNSHGHETHASH